ncbi:catalase HPII [Zymobacter palmae]|uniref:Catalase n=1 Tax=Zymobacter palmae TaxID=33074 RepID=A0A348HFL9_9GAMM|nr:catalase HPII [Zymobacter palmae]BBG30421.1 catalase [Zymobacter palmae]
MTQHSYTATNHDEAHDTQWGTDEHRKDEALETYRSDAKEHDLRTNQGVRIADNENSLKAGERGPTLLEDFILREKINHFDHERIPERIVHARGAAAHGYFQPYPRAAELSKAAVFRDPEARTPVFTRFSTVQGARGSNDTVRDIRGFAVKFYTEEGNWDLVGNNTPIFFIQDAIKFPDFVHAVKPEPHNDIPQGQSAHDTFWDFVSLVPETAHNVMWAMSDRALPRSFRSMEGFGIHTFRLIDRQGVSRFVRFHWKPLAGTWSLCWDEAQKLWARDPDFHRRDMWQQIDSGQPFEWELGVQVIEEKDEHAFDFDILDPTKLIPEECVPVTPIGKMVLNRNPDNYFAETEQVAFNPGNIVPGIDFSNDPLLQGRVFSYLDTQMLRLGGPNFHEIPINQPVCPFHNHQRDSFHRLTINKGQASYEPNSIEGGWPTTTPPQEQQGGFESTYERIDAHKVRARSPSFNDHYSQARLFWDSQTPVEQQHIIEAFTFELSKVTRPYIRQRVIEQILPNISLALAEAVAKAHGMPVPTAPTASPDALGQCSLAKAPSLSLMARPPQNIRYRQVAVLVADGACHTQLTQVADRLKQEGATPVVIAPSMAPVTLDDGQQVTPAATLDGQPSVTMDAVIVIEGSARRLATLGAGRYYLLEAYKHLKVIMALGEGATLLQAANLPTAEDGVLTDGCTSEGLDGFVKALSLHRVWSRDSKVASVAA